MGRLKGVETLKSKKEFDTVYKRGRAFHSPFFVIFYKEAPTKRVAFVASKKVGKAVARNRAKRVLRALALEFLDRLSDGWYIFVAKPALLESDYRALKKRMENLLKKGALL